MDINRANMDTFFTDLTTAFTEAYQAGLETRIVDQIAMTMPSTTAIEDHGWLNQIPKMREWIGDRQVKNIESNKLAVSNRKFELTIEVKREDIEDDKVGLYRNLAQYAGQNAAVHPDELCYDALVANGNWADGDAFFKADRTYGSNTIDNITTNALSESEFETAVTNMMGFVGHNDEPLNVMPKILLVGPSNRTTAFDICKNDFRASAASEGVQLQNRNKGLVVPIVSSRLVGTYAANWYLLGEVAGIKGLCYQERKEAELQDQRMDDSSDFVFENDLYQIGARARGEAFLALPHLIYGGVVA